MIKEDNRKSRPKDQPWIDINEIIPYDKNPRKHGKGILALEDSMKKHGWTNPVIITQDNKLVTGHGRLQAAKNLKIEKIPYVRIHMDEKEYLEILVSDNKISALSKFNNDLLKDVLDIMEGLDTIIAEVPGFTSEEIDNIFGHSNKEVIDATGDFGESGEVEGTIDPEAKVVSMTFKLRAKDHKKIKDKLSAIMRENDLESISEALMAAMQNFKGTQRVIRRTK